MQVCLFSMCFPDRLATGTPAYLRAGSWTIYPCIALVWTFSR
jgi:hypothetical protein